jgi:hypothetical protein
VPEKNDFNLWDKAKQGAGFIWKEHPTFRFLRWRVEWLNQRADQLNQDLNPFYVKPANAPQTDRQQPTAPQAQPSNSQPPLVIQPTPPYELVNPDFRENPFSIPSGESTDRSREPRSNPSPSIEIDPLTNPELDRQIKQAEREQVQREQAERRQEERERVRREQGKAAQAKRDQAEREQSNRARRESDRRSDKIIEDIAKSTEESLRYLEKSRKVLPVDNSPFGIPSSYISQINSSSNEANFGDKVAKAILLSMETGVLKKEVFKSMQELLTPESLAAMGGFIAVVGSANLAAAAIAPPIGPAIAAVADTAMAVLIVGGNAAALWEGSTALAGFLTKVHAAKTDADFLAAAKDFAKFANVVGPEVVSRMTGAAAGKALGAIGSKLASVGSEIGNLLPEKQKQIADGLRVGSDLLNRVGKKITNEFNSIFKHIDEALQNLTKEKKITGNLASEGKLPPGNGKKPDKPDNVKIAAEFPAESPIKTRPTRNPALKTSTNVQNSIILNIDNRLAEKQAALKELAEARALGKSKKDIEKINTKIGQADDALVNAGATWKLAEEGVNVTEFESKVKNIVTSRGAVAEADIGGKRWWVETGNGGGGKLEQIIKVLSNPEANKDRRSLIAYIPKFSESAVKQIKDAGGYPAKDYKELSNLVKQAERGELAALNPDSSLGRQFKGVLKTDGNPAVLPFDFNTLDHAFKNAVDLKGQPGIKYGYIITKQDSKILILDKSKATVLPIPGRDNQGVIVKFTPDKGQYKIELLTGEAAPNGLADELFRGLNLNEIFKKEISEQKSIPKGIHDYEGVISKRTKTISEGLSKEVYTAQAQLATLEQPLMGEQLRARMNAQKLALGWIDNKPNTILTAMSIDDSTQSIRMLNSSLNRQNRMHQALINQGEELKSLELNEVQAQTIANNATQISAENSRPKQNQREM